MSICFETILTKFDDNTLTRQDIQMLMVSVSLEREDDLNKLEIANNETVLLKKVIKFLHTKTFSEYLLQIIKNKWSIDSLFTLQEVYTISEEILQVLYPDNNSIKSSIRQNLQTLRDKGYIKFTNKRGNYKLLK